jgi:hypothetical protein
VKLNVIVTPATMRKPHGNFAGTLRTVATEHRPASLPGVGPSQDFCFHS